MKENCRKVTSCPFYSLFLALLAVLLMGIPAVSVQAAGVKTPGKVNITSVKMTGNNKVTINWKKASNATKYRIYYKQSGARSWKAIADVSSGKTSYTHTSNSRIPLAGGKKYVYTVRAYNKTSRKWGTYDKNGKGVTVPIVPGKVKLVSVKANVYNKVTVTWNKTSNASSYRIYYKKANAKNWTRVTDVKGSLRSYVHKSSKSAALIAGTQYVYTVRAYNSSSKKWGSYDAKGITVKVPAKPAAKPTVPPTPQPTATPIPTQAPSANTVTAHGVTFDMSYFPETAIVGDDMECLSVIPKSTIKPTDITYKIANGNVQQLCSPATPNLHLGYGTEYESDYYVSDWKNMVAYIKTSYEPEMYLEHRVEIYNQLQAGTFPVSVYYKNTLLRTCQVTVTGADSKVVKYRKWMNELEQKAWTSGMTVMEKLTAIKKYIYDNYTYTTDGVMCNAGAQALLYAARDLGLTARYRFVGPQYDYEKGYGDVYYHFGSAFCGGHVCTIITMAGKDYIMETQGHEG